jgi:chromosome segregation ATPase
LEQQKNELQEQLDERRRDVYVSSRKVSTLEYRVRELEHQNTNLSRELVKQQEDTRKAGLLFMNAADKYQEEARNQLRAKVEELANMRNADLLIMNTADAYQEAARKEIKEKVGELEDTRKAVLVLMNAANTYQRMANKKIKDMEEELKVIGAQKAEMDARAASLEGDYDEVKVENEKLRLGVERLVMELGVFTEAKDAAANSCNTETPEIMKELEDLETEVEETQANT